MHVRGVGIACIARITAAPECVESFCPVPAGIDERIAGPPFGHGKDGDVFQRSVHAVAVPYTVTDAACPQPCGDISFLLHGLYYMGIGIRAGK